MFFRTDLGDQIHIDNGIAWVKGVDGIEYPACAGNSTCAAFKASGVDLDELQSRADAALLDEHRRLGDTAEYTIRQIRRRRLHKNCDGTAGCGSKPDADHEVKEGDHRRLAAVLRKRQLCAPVTSPPPPSPPPPPPPSPPPSPPSPPPAAPPITDCIQQCLTHESLDCLHFNQL